MDFTRTLKGLQEASAFDLFRLRAAIDRVAVPQGEPRSSQTSIDDHGRCTTLVDLSGGVQIETVLIDRGPGPLVVQWGPP